VGVVLRALERVSLIQQHASGRYRMHDLIRLYAAEQAGHDQPEDSRDAALRRLVDFYLHTAYTGERLLYPHRYSIELGRPVAGCHPRPLHDPTTALAWLATEHPCLLAVHQLAIDRGWHSAVWQMAWTLTTFHGRRGHLQDQVCAWRAGLAAAEQLSDPAARTLAHRNLGRACARLGRHAEALDHLQHALALAEHTDDLLGQADTQHALARAWARQEDDQRALDHASHALHLYRTLDTPVREAGALNTVGWFHARLGHHQQAHIHCEAALALCRRHHDRQVEANTLDSLGYIAYHSGQHTQALDYYQQALTLCRSVGNSYDEANILDHLGQTHAALGQLDRALGTWHQALELYQAQHRTTDAEHIQHHLDQHPNTTKR
jgi:Tfp pilus assembly protein PilF